MTTVFVEPLLKWLKGLNSSQVGCSGCCCCSCPIAVCFSLWEELPLVPSCVTNLFLLGVVRALAPALTHTVGWEGGPALCEADPSLWAPTWAEARRTSLVPVLCLPWPCEPQPPLLGAGAAWISPFTADSWALGRAHWGPLARALLRVHNRPVDVSPARWPSLCCQCVPAHCWRHEPPPCPGLMLAQPCASACWSPLMHRRLHENKHWLPPGRAVPQNVALGCITEGIYSGQFCGFCREEQHQGQGWEGLGTPAFRVTELLLLQPRRNHWIPWVCFALVFPYAVELKADTKNDGILPYLKMEILISLLAIYCSL